MRTRLSIDIDTLSSFSNVDYELITRQIGMSEDVVDLVIYEFSTHYGGKLNRSEFAHLYRKINCCEETGDVSPRDDFNKRQVSDLVFKMFDIDHDNYLTIREFLLGMFVSTCGSLKHKAEYAFRLYDSNNDGWLTKDEIKSGLLQIFSLMGAKDVDALCVGDYIDESMKMFGTRGSRISKEQFVEALLMNESLRENLIIF